MVKFCNSGFGGRKMKTTFDFYFPNFGLNVEALNRVTKNSLMTGEFGELKSTNL